MMPRFSPVLPLIALVFVAACGSDGEADGGGSKGGEVAPAEIVEGTISDAMLPLDTVRSQAPQADAESLKPDGESKPASSDNSQAEDNASEAEPAEAAAEPAAPAPRPAADPIAEAISGGGQ